VAPVKPLVSNNCDLLIKYVSVPTETLSEEVSPLNGMGSGDSIPVLLGDNESVFSVQKPAGSVSKREGGYIHPGSVGSACPACQPETGRISAIVQPISAVVKSIFSTFGFVFGCNQKPSYDSCGKIRAKIVCSVDETHRPYFKHERCNDPGCPICYTKFARRIADAVVKRVQGYMSVFGFDPISHLIFWPDSLTGYSNLQEAFRDAKFMLGKLGAKMAVVWYHPYRIPDDIKEQLRRYRREHGISNKTGFWEMAHDDVLNLGSLEAYVVYGPHFHAIVSGYLKSSKEYAKLGIGGYKKVRRLDAVEDLERVAYYISTHACREATKSTVRYFGKISYSKLARDEGTEIIEDVICEVCGKLRMSYHCNDEGETSGVLQHHITRKVTIHKYWERGKEPQGVRKSRRSLKWATGWFNKHGYCGGQVQGSKEKYYDQWGAM